MLVSPTYPAIYIYIYKFGNPKTLKKTVGCGHHTQGSPQAILQDRLHVSESTFAATGRVSLERAEEKEAPDDVRKM